MEFTDNPYKAGTCVHTKTNQWNLLIIHIRLVCVFTTRITGVVYRGYVEFEARGGISGWIGKSGSDEGGNRPDQEGQQKHLSKVKPTLWRLKLQLSVSCI